MEDAPLPYQENLLLANQYRPGLPRPVYRLVAEGGLVKVRRTKKVRKTTITTKRPRVREQPQQLPSRVLLGRVRADKEGPAVQTLPTTGDFLSKLGAPRDEAIHNISPRNPVEARSQLDLWQHASSHEFYRAEGAGSQESGGELISDQDSTKKLINHNMQTRIYFLPS